MSGVSPHLCLFSCHNLVLSRGGFKLCEGVGFSLLDGGILLLTGPNGAGKSSLLKAMAGLLPLDSGEMLWRGENAGKSERYAAEMLYLGHANGLKEAVTVAQNLRFWSILHDTQLLLPAAVHYFGLTPYLEAPCRELSAGWKRRVALSRLLLAPANLWLLDEPAANLDAEGVTLLGGLIASRTQKGGAVIMSAHQLPAGLLKEGMNVGELALEDYASEL